MKATKVTAVTATTVLAALMIAFGACSGCHTDTGGTTVEQEEHECPPCPPCPSKTAPVDPLAGSTLDDGFTDEQREQFIRENVRSTLRITVAMHSKSYGAGFGGGTGVAIRPQLVLTAAHVVEDRRFFWGMQRMLARDNLSILWPRATFLRVLTQTSELRDVALLQLTDGETMPRPIPLSMGRTFSEGDLVWHFGRTTRWSRGRIVDASDPRHVKTNFTVAGGDSGGPVVWPDGSLAGIILSRSKLPEHRVDDNTSSIGYFITVDEAIRGISSSSMP